MLVLDEVHKMFDRSSSFRACYDSFKTLKDDFFSGIPIMALKALKAEYEQCGKWLYGFLAWTCLRKSLLESFKFTDVFELADSGECCSSCDISTARRFNCKETAAPLLKALE